MKTVYIDTDFKCHVKSDGTTAEVQTDFFDGKCDAFIEGYRFVPAGHEWTRDDGMVFRGLMIAPWKSYAELEELQRQYEAEQIAEMNMMLTELMGGVEDVQYE